MKWLLVAAFALALGAVALPARADTSITALGSASLGGGDAVTARQRALDDAFRQAIEQTLASFVDAPTRQKLGDALQKRILRRAKGYVTQFKITTEGESEGIYHLQIEAQVADARLRADVRALGGSSADPGPQPEPAAARRPKLVILSRAQAPVLAVLAKEIEAQGFGLLPSDGAETSVDPAQAIALAQRVGAGGAVTAGIEVADVGAIRGTKLHGAEVKMSVRVDDASGRVVDVDATGAGFGEGLDQASVAAARDAAARIGKEIGPRLQSHWPDERPVGAGIDVHVRGASRWAEVEGVRKGLGAAAGVRRVVVSRFARREVTLRVSGPVSARALADSLAGEPRIVARATGREVVADVQPDTGGVLTP